MIISGIYKITCTINNKFYIGSSSDIKKRFGRHKYALRNNIHENKHMQNAWNKYGGETFIFEIIEITNNDNLIEAEQMWMDKTECFNHEIGFNVSEIAQRGTFGKFSENVREKIQLANSKEWIVTDHNNKEQKICNLEEFCRENQLCPSGMRAVAYGLYDRHNGWKCRFSHMTSDELQSLRDMKRKNLNAPRPNTRKKYIVINPSGEQFEIIGINNFCKENNLNCGSMTSVASGKRNHYKGWKCKKLVDGI
jgi:group I intron endonuclease